LTVTNRCELDGRIVAIEPLRYTPAGIPIVRMTIEHASEQIEAGMPRQVGLEIGCVLTDAQARLAKQATLGAKVSIEGFIAPKSKARRSLEIHVRNIRFE
jgi:primosomal replication protein N